MGKLFCLMGKSSSGKDTIYAKLLEQEKLCLRSVVPYTTRPIRAGEIDGKTYFFCSGQKAQELEDAGKVIERRTYHTVHGEWHYFTADDGQIDLSESNYLMIGTPVAYEKLCAYFGLEHVVGVYIWVEDGERLSRALSREKKQKEPKYAEMCRRFLADQEDFSKERLQHAGVKWQFENRNLEQTLDAVVDCIQKEAN